MDFDISKVAGDAQRTVIKKFYVSALENLFMKKAKCINFSNLIPQLLKGGIKRTCKLAT